MKKFLIGCGIVFGVFALAGIGVAVWATFTIKNSMPDTERAERFQEELIAAHGAPQSYVPPTGGAFLEEPQLERYLTLRAAMRVPAAKAAGALDDLTARFGEEFDESSGWEKTKTIFGSIKGGMNLAHEIVEYSAIRDSLLLDAEFGIGEFTYVNSLILFAFLDWDPETAFEDHAGEGDDDVQQVSRDALRTAEKLFRAQLENLVAALDGLEQLDDRQTEMLTRVEEALDARRRRGEFILEGRLDDATIALLQRNEVHLREYTPTTLGQAVVEAANFDALDKDGSGVQINVQ